MLSYEHLIGAHLTIHEIHEDGARYSRRFFTDAGDCIFKHEFDLVGQRSSEVMALSTEPIVRAAYNDLRSTVGKEIRIVEYEKDPIVRIVVSTNSVILKAERYDDLDSLEILLKTGRSVTFKSDSPPPFVDLMTVSEFVPTTFRQQPV